MAFYSSGVEYGIHSLMCMVDAKGNEREMSVREMAALQGVPRCCAALCSRPVSIRMLICSPHRSAP